MTNKELLDVVMAVELFKYYLTGRHFTVVTDHTSPDVATQLQRARRDGGPVDLTLAAL